MAILKSEIRNKFTTIPNSIVRAKDLSDGDYRLLIYLYSLPNGWKINQSYLGQELGCSRENINKKLARLKKTGYLEITKNSENKEVDYIYTLKEKSVSENNTCDGNNHNPLCQQVSHVIASDVIVNDTHINTNIINTDNNVINTITKKEEDLQQSPSKFNPFEFYENNFGTLSSFISEKLVAFENEYGSFKLQKALEESVLKDVKKLSYVEAILQNWKDKTWNEILKEQDKIKKSKNSRSKTPEWFNKEIKKEEPTEEERKELEEMMKEFKEGE